LIHSELLLIVTVSVNYRYPVPVPAWQFVWYPVLSVSGRVLKIALRYISTKIRYSYYSTSKSIAKLWFSQLQKLLQS